jgi:hypothetical protein
LAIEDLDWSISNPDLEASDAEATELNMAVKTAIAKPAATEIVTIAEDSDSQSYVIPLFDFYRLSLSDFQCSRQRFRQY